MTAGIWRHNYNHLLWEAKRIQAIKMKTLLFILIALITVTTTISGLLMISAPNGSILGLSTELLANTPFNDFMMPGILLTLFVGSINLLAIFFHMERSKRRYNWSMAGGVTITIWIIVQMILIQAIHWIELLYLGFGILVILIAYQLKGKWAV